MTVRELFERYGPTVAVIATLTLLVVIFPTQSREGTTLGTGGGDDVAADLDFEAPTAPGGSDGTVAAGGGTGGATGGTGGTTGGTSGGSGTGATGSTGGATGTAGGSAAAGGGNWPQFVGEGAGCHAGRQAGISPVMPPCSAPWQAGPTAGTTGKGVTDDKIVVVWYRGQTNLATQAALRAIGADDTREDQIRIYEMLRRYFNNHYQTYGREVVFVPVDASGPAENDEAMKADAIKVAEEVGAFAVFGSDTTVFTQEVVARGVVCLCTVSLSTTFYMDNPPYIFSSLPTAEEYFLHYAEYIGKRLAGEPAKWAGDPTMQAQPRKFGLFWFGGVRGRVDPYRKPPVDLYKRELSRYGVRLSAEVMYLYELERAGEHSANMIAKMKNSQVSNLLCACDPLYPIFLTKEATRQNYFPEWFISGTALIDTTFFGRTYDQAQWRNAFGISPLWVFWENVERSTGYREYHHAAPQPSQPGDEGVAINVYRSTVQLLFTGIHMAGPNLNADTFAQGMFNYPPTGGTPATPFVFFTRESPNAIKDFTEVWWNPTGSGKDETGNEGAGVLMKAENGKRYKAGEWPEYEPKVFVAEGSVYTTDNPPGGFGQPHEDDGHRHDGKRCMSCT